MKITKWDGKPVSINCCLSGLPIELYHGDCTEGPAVSSSGLRKIESKTPAHYYATSYLNPNRLDEEPKDHFSFGQAAHTLLLSEEGFREKFVVRPGQWKDWRTKDAQTWKAEQQLAGRTVLVDGDIEAIRGIAEQVAAHPLVKAGLLNGEVERSLIWRDTITGVWLKARPDVIPVSDGMLADIKTTTDASPRSIEKTIENNGYAMQGALAAMGMKAVLDIKMTDFVLVWIEKTAPYAVNIAPVDPDWIYWSMRQIRRAIDTFARCVEANHWPGYEGENTSYLPSYLRIRFEAQEKLGLLPEVEHAA